MGNVLVIGASGGIGGAVARAFGERGDRLALLGRDRAALAAVGHGFEALALTADLTDDAALTRALAEAQDWAGGALDVAVHAAGITGPLGAPVPEIAPAAFDAVMAVNLRSAFLLLRAVLPPMQARGTGRVIAVGGTHGLRGRAGRAAFSAAKWGLRGLMRSAALEVAASGVTVNLVMPGPVAVPRMARGWAAEAAATGTTAETVRAAYTARMGGAMGRLSEPNDVAAAVLFLAGPAGRTITGQELTLDGGTIV